MSITSPLQPTKAETAVLASEILDRRIEELPSVSERTLGKPKSPIAMVSTQVLSARLHGKASNDVNNHVFGAAQAEDFVFYGVLSQGSSKRLDAPVVRVDSQNMLWIQYGRSNQMHPRAILFDGHFTAISHKDFAPRSQTQRRYGVASKDVRPTLESPLAIWLRSNWQNYITKESPAAEAVQLMARGQWSRAATAFTSEVFRSINEFYSRFSTDEEALVGTFLSDGMTKDEAISAVESLRD